ncbi:MAG: hypothetical protein PHE67_08425 [Campylobacterales bacterium]|nr:hypothetical protein [Campylobacterales bacterium]
MIKKMLLATFLTLFAWADNYNEFLIETQLSLLPKIALLEKTALASKDVVDIIIVYNSEDEDAARYAVGFLDRKFQGKIGRYPMKISMTTFDKCCPPYRASLVYCLNGRESQLSRVQAYAKHTKSVTAVYDTSNLKGDFLFSVALEKIPVILMNKKALKDGQFDFPQTLYAIVRPVQ